MSLNPKQQAIVNWAKSHLEFFETSNDVKSYTHYNDIEQTIEAVCDEQKILPGDCSRLNTAMDEFYTVLKNLQ